MIAINKAEAEAIRKHCRGAHIVRTMKQKSKRHHYFCEETSRVMKVIRKMRGEDEDYPKQKRRNQKRGGKNGGFKPKTKRDAA